MLNVCHRLNYCHNIIYPGDFRNFSSRASRPRSDMGWNARIRIFVGFEGLTLWFYLDQALALGLIFLVDYLALAFSIRKFRGSKYTVWGALAGLFIGITAVGPLGLIFGPWVGALLVELLAGRSLKDAFRTGFGTLLGLLGGTVAKVTIEVIMIIWFFFKIVR